MSCSTASSQETHRIVWLYCSRGKAGFIAGFTLCYFPSLITSGLPKQGDTYKALEGIQHSVTEVCVQSICHVSPLELCGTWQPNRQDKCWHCILQPRICYVSIYVMITLWLGKDLILWLFFFFLLYSDCEKKYGQRERIALKQRARTGLKPRPLR